jgi:hypothetical protein
VPGDHPQPLGLQRGAGGEVRPVERPVGVLGELEQALVVAVGRGEEGARVTGVDDDGPAESAAEVPERVDPGVVDRDQRPARATAAEAQALVDLQPARPARKPASRFATSRPA